jgi:hypothetical protein
VAAATNAARRSASSVSLPSARDRHNRWPAAVYAFRAALTRSRTALA